MHLLEREHPLRSLSEYAAESRLGAGRLVLVAGEAGAGKTSLIDRFQADLSDVRWLRAACDGLFTPRPLGPLHDLAEDVGGLDLRSGGGRGVGLWDGLEALEESYEIETVSSPSDVTHQTVTRKVAPQGTVRSATQRSSTPAAAPSG